MLEIRIHGRGGQGNVSAAYLLAAAMVRGGFYAQAFPAFGAERRGAPVAAFVRVAHRTIMRRCEIVHPDIVIVQDPLLLEQAATLHGVGAHDRVLVNTGHGREMPVIDGLPECTVGLPAGEIAERRLGRPIPNAPLLGAFVALTELIPLAHLREAMEERFPAMVAERNIAAVDDAVELVDTGSWGELAHAIGD